MREILFRGKRRDNGEWFYGDLLHLTYCVSIRSKKCAHSIIPETAGEYTGLTDKNGKRIFEHDVVRRFNSKGKEIMRYIVKWCNECCMFALSYCGDDMEYDTDFTVFSGTELEVIGNETDNPELLKGE